MACSGNSIAGIARDSASLRALAKKRAAAGKAARRRDGHSETPYPATTDSSAPSRTVRIHSPRARFSTRLSQLPRSSRLKPSPRARPRPTSMKPLQRNRLRPPRARSRPTDWSRACAKPLRLPPRPGSNSTTRPRSSTSTFRSRRPTLVLRKARLRGGATPTLKDRRSRPKNRAPWLLPLRLGWILPSVSARRSRGRLPSGTQPCLFVLVALRSSTRRRLPADCRPSCSTRSSRSPPPFRPIRTLSLRRQSRVLRPTPCKTWDSNYLKPLSSSGSAKSLLDRGRV